ncbi:hypothetical protein D9M68_268280 [compost metagenome]
MELHILGTRGIPAKHGGFETFAERLSLHLAKKGWKVHVYCQELGSGKTSTSQWKGINLVHIPVKGDGTLGTIIFDWKATLHATKQQGLFLTLGYNTAIFNVIQRIFRQTNVINMDGIEWRRDKWGVLAKTWFWLNERAGCWIGNHLVADHPKIREHLATRISSDKITMIPYGADKLIDADIDLLSTYSIAPYGYSIIIARPEPENSVLEIVRSFSQKKRNHKLVVLGNFSLDKNKFHRRVVDAASDEVIFPGAIYDAPVVQALRFYSRFYLHGHRVGGTNPSLVEALGAGCAVIAHDNHFNRWVAGPGAAYFSDEATCARLFDHLLENTVALEQMKSSSLEKYHERFTWDQVLSEYEELLSNWHPKAQ